MVSVNIVTWIQLSALFWIECECSCSEWILRTTHIIEICELVESACRKEGRRKINDLDG